jgi:hypothetical protein
MKRRKKLKYNLKCNYPYIGIRCNRIAIEFWQYANSDKLAMRCEHHPFNSGSLMLPNRPIDLWHKIDPGEAAILEVLII